jgi:hypothetical protein
VERLDTKDRYPDYSSLAEDIATSIFPAPTTMSSSPGAYGQGVNDANQTVTLANSVVGLVGGVVSSQWRRRSGIQSLREKFGEWASEAQDANHRWLRPVLRTKAFEDHLVNTNGYMQPSGKCTSSFAWAHLLYALDIKPGAGVLEWRLPTDGVDPIESGRMSLDIDGAVLCHIINLYRIYHEAAPRGFTKGDSDASFEFPFGKLSVRKEDSGKREFCVQFFPGTAQELSSIRQPFVFPLQFRQRHAIFGKETVVTQYFNAIHYGNSDTAALLLSPTEPLQKRTRSLLSALQKLNESN